MTVLKSSGARRAALVLLAAGAAAVVGGVGGAGAFADTRPPTGVPATVSTDPLPTPQIDGVAWTQVIVGNTVWVGGRFTTARPAGAAPGTSTIPRGNLLAYDLTSGALLPFAPSFNAEIRGLTASPDGSRVYAVGAFTSVSGQAHTRIVALDASTGAPIASFNPSLNSTGIAVTARGTTVYAGGSFTAASGVARGRVAAFTAATGAVTGFAPMADAAVRGIAVSPDSASVVIGGAFATVNGSTQLGSAKIDAATGKQVQQWLVNQTVGNNGPDAAIYSVTSDANSVYATGYDYNSHTAGKKLEGAYQAAWSNGAIRWIEDCHGDSYSSAVANGALYIASHEHYCGNVVNGFPQTTDANGKVNSYQRATAFSLGVAGTLKADTMGYANFGGNPSPQLLDWFPTMPAGLFTGQYQGPWNVVTNGSYVVYGGEFPSVNGKPQQGLVRFAISSLAPNRDGPRVAAANWTPTATAVGGGAVQVSIRANYDRDNQYLTYTLLRDGVGTGTPVTVGSRIWYQRPTTTMKDSGLAVGSVHTYQVVARDPFGNAAKSAAVTVTVK